MCRIVADQAGLTDAIELEWVTLRSKDNPVISLSPLGRVPVLVDGDLTLAEARHICAYLDEKGGRTQTVARYGDWQAVATLTESALDQGTFHPEALILRGYALNTIGDYPAALAHYRSAVDMRPNDIQLLNGLAIAAQNLKQVDLARVTYLKALQVVDSPDTRYNLAGLLLQSGHPM